MPDAGIIPQVPAGFFFDNSKGVNWVLATNRIFLWELVFCMATLNVDGFMA
jgi:hypothetical protein